MEKFLSEHPYLALTVFVWTIAWKGVALWKSAKRSEKVWFIAMLLINSLGLLEIFYIFVASEGRLSMKKSEPPTKPETPASPQT